MTDRKPIEPSAVLAPDGTRVAHRRGPARVAASGATGALLPTLVRAATRGHLLTASVLGVAGAAAAQAAGVAARTAWRAARAAADAGPVQRAGPGGVEISWTHVEIRWRA
jgi:hypothetical protein